MSIQAKVDEDLPAGIAQLLRQAGHDALTVAEQRLAGSSDESLWSVVQLERRLLITADKGFADVRAHPPGSHNGVILLRLEEESRTAYLSLMHTLLSQTALDDLVGAVAVVTERGIRIRRAP